MRKKKNNKSNNNEDENIDSINESTKNLHFNGNNNKSVFNFDEAYEEGRNLIKINLSIVIVKEKKMVI